MIKTLKDWLLETGFYLEALKAEGQAILATVDAGSLERPAKRTVPVPAFVVVKPSELLRYKHS